MKHRALAVLAAGALLASISLTAEARGGGPGGHFGGMSSGHLSDRGVRNSNGPNALDRSKGLERADNRRHAGSLAHGKADKAHAKRKHHAAPTRQAPALSHADRDAFALPRPHTSPLPGRSNFPAPSTPRLP